MWIGRFNVYKAIAIGIFVVACVYVWVTGDYTLAGPRYRSLAYANMAVEQLGRLLASPAESEKAGNQSANTGRATGGTSMARDRIYAHLASVHDADAARQEWSRLQRILPAEFADLDLILERVRHESEGTIYRVLADTDESPLSPRQLCTALRRSNQFCVLVKPGTS